MYLRAHEVFEDHSPPESGDSSDGGHGDDWGDFVAIDRNGDPVVVTREDVGTETPATPQLAVDTDLELADGSTVSVRTDFTRQKDNILDNYDPETVEEITTIPADALQKTAREFAAELELLQVLAAQRSVAIETGERAAAERIERAEGTAVGVHLADFVPAMAHEAVRDLLTDTAWGDLDTLVLDLPPGTGDVVLTTLQSVPVDGVVLVTTPYPTAVADTARSATLFEENAVDVLGAVVNMTEATCPECGHGHDLFPEGDVREALSVPVLAELPFDPAIREGVGGPVDDGDAETDADDLPDAVTDLGDAVRDRLADTGGIEVPESALDLRGVPPQIRDEQVAVEADALDPGERLVCLTAEDPTELARSVAAAEEWQVDRRGPDTWVLAVEV